MLIDIRKTAIIIIKNFYRYQNLILINKLWIFNSILTNNYNEYAESSVAINTGIKYLKVFLISNRK